MCASAQSMRFLPSFASETSFTRNSIANERKYSRPILFYKSPLERIIAWTWSSDTGSNFS